VEYAPLHLDRTLTNQPVQSMICQMKGDYHRIPL